MKILLFSISLILIALFLHYIWWRIRIPPSPIIALLLLFTAILGVGLICAYSFCEKYSFLIHGIWENLHVVIIYIPITLCYIITYAGLEDDSPSMTIVQFVAQAGDKGRSRQEFSEIITDRALMYPRLDAIIQSGMVDFSEKRYRLTPKGRLYDRLFSLWSNLLNIPKGG